MMGWYSTDHPDLATLVGLQLARHIQHQLSVVGAQI